MFMYGGFMYGFGMSTPMYQYGFFFNGGFDEVEACGASFVGLSMAFFFEPFNLMTLPTPHASMSLSSLDLFMVRTVRFVSCFVSF